MDNPPVDNACAVSAVAATICHVQLRIAVSDGRAVRTVSIRAPQGARWDTVRDLVLPEGPTDLIVEYAGTRLPLLPDLVLGLPPLVQGAAIAPGSALHVASVSPARFLIASGPDAGASFDVPAGGRLTIGREQWCDVVIDDPGLSRHHVTLSATRKGILVEDAASTNGTRLDGDRVVGPTPWVPGASLRAGSTTLTLQAASATVARGHPDGAGRIMVTPRGLPVPAIEDVHLDLPEPAQPAPPTPPSVLGWALPMLVSVLLAIVLRMPTLLLFGLMAPAMSLGSYAGDRRRHRRDCAAAAASHEREVTRVRRAASRALKREEHVRATRTPDLATLIHDAQTTGPSLWCRVDSPLLWRAGLGPQASTVTVDGRPEAGAHLPLEVDLTGGLALIGPPRLTRAAARSLLLQLALQHPPSQLAIHVMGRGDRSPHGPDPWEWVAWLPHAADGSGAAKTLRLHDRTDATGGQRSVVSPGGEEQCVIPIVLARTEASVPDLMTVAHCHDTRVRLHSGGRVNHGSVDLVSHGRAVRTARTLSAMTDGLAGTEHLTIPDQVELEEVAPGPFTAETVATAWRHRPRSTRFILGKSATGDVALDLVADGPHALVAGTTGSGKSELLRTLVASLALANRPDELVMVLVDYKGGSAFAEAADLPHVVGVITDLDPHLANRALTSLTAELKRRERILAAVGATDLPAYQAAGNTPPLPRLLLVIDEFRALAEELPSFLDGLVRLAALGRSLGVHLVLATQRPGGVISADVRANVNLRIALRVRDSSDSYDVIESTAAADLPEGVPGRALIRTGASLPRMVQVASSTGPTAHSGEAHDTVSVCTVHDLWEPEELDHSLTSAGPALPAAAPCGAVSPGTDSPAARPSASFPGPTALAAVIGATRAAAEQVGAAAPPSPWLAPLPEHLTLARLPADPDPSTAGGTGTRPGGPSAYALPLLMTDLPDQQTQAAHHWDPLRDGHLGIVGAARTGRSTFARTVAAGLLRRSPDETQIYAFDQSGSLGSLAAAPHVGAVITSTDAARGAQVIAHLSRLVTERQRGLAAAGHTSLAEQRSVDSAPWPLVVLLVDGWPRFVETFGEVDRGRPLEQVLQLLREGRAVGVVAVLTGDRSLLSGRVAAQLGETWALHLSDASDLLMAGLTRAQLPGRMPPGRVIRLRDGVVGQVAVVGSSSEGAAQVRALNELIDTWSGTQAEAPPACFRPLPRRCTLAALPASRVQHLVLGVGGHSARPVDLPVDPVSTLALGVVGPPGSGRSTTARTLSEAAGQAGWRVVEVRDEHLHDTDRLRAALADVGDELAGRNPGTAELGHPLMRANVLVVVDGLSRVASTLAEDLLLDWLEAPRVESRLSSPVEPTSGSRVLVATGDPQDFGGFRGIAARITRERTGIVLQPTQASDGSALGVTVPTGDEPLPGRGVLVLRGTCTAVQVAVPGREQPR